MKLAPGIVHYVAREAVRRDILRLAQHYKDAYAYASAILPRFLRPPAGRYTDPADVRRKEFLAALRKHYPRESRTVLDILAWYTVYYEYLS